MSFCRRGVLRTRSLAGCYTFSVVMQVRFFSFLIALGALPFGCAATMQAKPKVDTDAMREAIAATRSGQSEPASAAGYGHYLRARLAHFEGNGGAAIDELRLAIASDSRNAFLMTQLAEEYARASDLSRAEAELWKVVELRPKYYPAHVLLGRVLYESQKQSKATAQLKIAIRLRPVEPEPYLVLAQLQLDQKQYIETIRTIEALEQHPRGKQLVSRNWGLPSWSVAIMTGRSRSSKRRRNEIRTTLTLGSDWLGFTKPAVESRMPRQPMSGPSNAIPIIRMFS